ncbi:hypothetical protein ACLE20_05445 [Rhizobium sp. YIM 134829]|uniref:hypothetical protein n=1 Tax=Rhizobium sp. YIM 134829 TaxID=3390453 RepID=UPI00397DFE91
MQTGIHRIVAEAEQKGLVVPGRAGELTHFLQARGLVSSPSKQAEAGTALEDSEQPHFVRGFHDILITIGILVLTAGTLGLGSALIALPVSIALSEIFVRRQRLALPSVVLSVIAVSSAAAAAGSFLGDDETGSYLIGLAAILTLAAALYHWRYRTPISLAGVYYGAGFLVFAVVLTLIFGWIDFDFSRHGNVSVSWLLAAIGLALFAIALAYDLSDPQRLTRRSDVAFWLHLGAAPLVLHALVGLVSGATDFLPSLDDPSTAAFVVAATILVMLVGLIIDRRAFVTSGLLSLGAALAVLMQQGLHSVVDANSAAVAVVVGVIVLAIGLFWSPLRRVLLDRMPGELSRRLPPAR